MKRFAILVQSISFLMYLCTSCVDESLVKLNSSEVQFRFSVSTAEEGLVNVKSSSHDVSTGVNDVWVVVFEGDDKQIKTSVKAVSVGNDVYYATLEAADLENTKLLVLANIERIMAANANFGRDYDELKSNLVVQLNKKDKLIVQDASPVPMASELEPYSASEINFELKRSAAKVTVGVASGNTKYKLLGANLASVASRGYVFDGLSNTNYNIGNYAGIVTGDTYSTDMALGVSTDGLTTPPLYVFDTPKDNKPSVIVKGEFDGVVGFIRLALWDASKEYYDVERNNQYIVNIRSITIAGYPTADEAINNAPSNDLVGADITVTDPSAHDIVSNGAQYLGVSNSSLIIYNSGNVDNLLATVCTYTCAQNWVDQGSKGIITATGEGLTLADGSKESQFDLTAVDKATQDVKIDCDKSFQNGTLTLHIGNLSKVIHVEKRDSLPATPDELLFENVTVGDQKGSEVRDDIQFSGESGKYDLKDQQGNLYFSNTGKLYVLVSANVGYGTSLRDRTGEFFIASSEDDGRTKVAFAQKKLDIYSELTQIRPYTFVGTFHRANETAERIIRIKTTEKAGSKWKALVVAGQDFIELDGDRSPDAGITKYAYGVADINNPNAGAKDDANWKTASDVEANGKFTSAQKGKILISGEITNDTPCVYFRVGMKSTLPGGATGAPRYGLIALMHATGIHMIYVRQGEADDYLMRPSDPITGGDAIGQARLLAKKVAPFNLTLNKTLRDQQTKFYDFTNDGEKAVFTDYPSQGGYFFQGNPSRAYYPIGKKEDVGWQHNNINGDIDLYPAGYRLFVDGVPENYGSVVGSEMRQSFWLNPHDGMEQSSYDNMLRGYIADGYYDRRPMRVPNTQGHQEEGYDIYNLEDVNGTKYTIPTLVDEGAEIGYAGMLLYNPYNYASIFVPANGSRFGSLENMNFGKLRGTGAESNLWSSTISGGSAWYLATGYYYAYKPGSWSGSMQFVFDNYKSSREEAFSLRCAVK